MSHTTAIHLLHRESAEQQQFAAKSHRAAPELNERDVNPKLDREGREAREIVTPRGTTPSPQSSVQKRGGVFLAGGGAVQPPSLTRIAPGDERPKQFCPIPNGQTLLADALRRAEQTVPREQLLVSLTRSQSGLLDLAKAGGIQLDCEKFDLATEIAWIVAGVEPLAQQKSLRIDIEADRTSAFADRKRFEQILTNLLTNAIKFTPSGGRACIDAVRAPNGGVQVSVRDTGIGIPAGDIDRIFDPFFQAEDSLKSGQGTGLGLALTKLLVETHGGRIWVRSQPGTGSEFSFSLPAQELGPANTRGAPDAFQREGYAA